MSELKAFVARKIDDGTCDPVPCIEVYPKSEADKVIAHHKYKRCLAMAWWCMTEYIQSKCLDFTNTEQWYWRRWHIRWRELAEKFKEAK